MLFYTGLNSGMMVSDVVKLNYDDVKNPDRTILCFNILND